MQKFVSTRIASTRISRPSQPGQKKGWRTRVIAPHYAFPSLAWRRKVLRGGKQPAPLLRRLDRHGGDGTVLDRRLVHQNARWRHGDGGWRLRGTVSGACATSTSGWASGRTQIMSHSAGQCQAQGRRSCSRTHPMVLAPFLDLVEISAVCIERIIGFLMRPIVGDHGGQLIVVPYFSQRCPD